MKVCHSKLFVSFKKKQKNKNRNIAKMHLSASTMDVLAHFRFHYQKKWFKLAVKAFLIGHKKGDY